MAEVIDLGDQQVPVEKIPTGAYMADDRRDIGRLSKSESGRTAAALATANLMASFIDNPTSQRVADNASEVLEEIRDQLGADEEQTIQPVPQPVSRTESGLMVVQQPEAEEEQLPTEYEIPAEYAWLNDPEPAPEDDEDLEPAAEAPAVQEPDLLELDDDDLLDPRIAQLKAERDAAVKKANFERNQRVKSTRPSWEQDAMRLFRLGDVPLLDAEDLASIKADSHRSFMKQAKAIADNNKRVIGRVTPSRKSEDDIRREVKQEVWGPPPASAPPSDAQLRDRDERLARARRTGNLGNIFKEMIRG